MPAENAPTNPRANWPVRMVPLAEDLEESDTTPEQRLAMMWELITQAWALAGRAIPDYDRAHTPISVRRRDEVLE